MELSKHLLKGLSFICLALVIIVEKRKLLEINANTYTENKTSAFRYLVAKRVQVSTLRKNELYQSDVALSKDTETFYIFIVSRGRFGNLLFKYASILGIAKHADRYALFDKKMNILRTVFPRINLTIYEESPKSWNILKEKNVWDFDQKFYNLPCENVTIDSYLASFRYFENINSYLYSNILHHIKPGLLSITKKYTTSVKTKYAFNNNGIIPKTVCLHIRRGDKAKMMHAGSDFQLPTARDILNAMKFMENVHVNVAFIIASDSKQWCQQYLLKNNVYISNLTTFQEDFVLMTSCNHIIMTVGTFGWWASWMTSQQGGTVLYYKHPFVNGSQKYKTFNQYNSFPSHWIGYNNVLHIK